MKKLMGTLDGIEIYLDTEIDADAIKVIEHQSGLITHLNNLYQKGKMRIDALEREFKKHQDMTASGATPSRFGN